MGIESSNVFRQKAEHDPEGGLEDMGEEQSVEAAIIPRRALRRLFRPRLDVGRAGTHRIFNQDAEGVRRNLLPPRTLPIPNRAPKFITKRGELAELMLDGLEVLFRQAEHTPARALAALAHAEDFSNFPERKPKGLGLANKKQPPHVSFTIDPVARILAQWVRHEALALIEAHCLNRDAALFRKLPNLHTTSCFSLPLFLACESLRVDPKGDTLRRSLV